MDKVAAGKPRRRTGQRRLAGDYPSAAIVKVTPVDLQPFPSLARPNNDASSRTNGRYGRFR